METISTPDGTTTWKFTKAELIALLAHASTEPMRESLYGLVLEASLGRAFATDGHRLAMVTAGARLASQDATKTRAIIPTDVLAQVVKLAGKKDIVRITPNCTTVKVEVSCVDRWQNETPGPSFTGPLGAADNCPPVDEVLPAYAQNHTGTVAGINTAYLADLELVARASSEHRLAGVMLYPPSDPTSPFKAECNAIDGTRWVVAIMPMRI